MLVLRPLEDRLDRESNTFTIDEVNEFFDKNKKRGTKTIEALKGVIDNIDINFNTKIGREILKDDIERFQYLLTKIIIEEANEAERAEFRAVRSRLDRISKRLDIFTESLKNVGGNHGRR
jgi:hypothetical protein